MAFHLNS